MKFKELNLKIPWIGGIKLVPDEAQWRAAWELYVELRTRISTVEMADDEGLDREALVSLYELFQTTRATLKQHGPAVGAREDSVGGIALTVLDKGLRPFLTEWHPLLETWEAERPDGISRKAHEMSWDQHPRFRQALRDLQIELNLYADELIKICESAP